MRSSTTANDSLTAAGKSKSNVRRRRRVGAHVCGRLTTFHMFLFLLTEKVEEDFNGVFLEFPGEESGIEASVFLRNYSTSREGEKGTSVLEPSHQQGRTLNPPGGQQVDNFKQSNTSHHEGLNHPLQTISFTSETLHRRQHADCTSFSLNPEAAQRIMGTCKCPPTQLRPTEAGEQQEPSLEVCS